MSNKRHTPPRAGPRLIDRLELAMSTGRHVDGIWIGSFRGGAEDLARVERAMLLVKEHSPLHYARIIRDLERIWVHVLPYSVGEYNASLKACLIDERYVADPKTSIEQIASTIVHEATHARLDRNGVGYEEEQRARIEAICFRRELAFAARLPDGAELQQEIARCLDWYQANPEHLHDAHFQLLRKDGEIEALRHVGVPDWAIRAVLALRPVVFRARRLLRFAGM